MFAKNDYTGETSTLLILGAGNLGQVVAEMAQMTGQYTMIAFLDDNPTPEKQELFHIVGKISDIESFAGKYTYAIPAFGNNQARHDLRLKIKQIGLQLPRIIHQTAVISPTAKIENGVIVRENVVISRKVHIKEGCIINIGALIDHGCVIGEDAHIPMGAVVRNNIEVSDMAWYHPGEIIQ